MSEVLRIGESHRWSDIVIHRGVAYWVEVANDLGLDAGSQIKQVLAQIDETLVRIGSDRSKLIQVLIYLADLRDAGTLNTLWDEWVPRGHPPVRACVQAGLGGSCRVEMVITAAVDAEQV